MRSKELSVELRDRIVSRHRFGEGYQKMSATLKVPKKMEDVWNHQESSQSWPPSQTEQSGEKGLGEAGDQEDDGHSDRAPEFLCGDGRTFQKNNHLCSTSPIRPLW